MSTPQTYRQHLRAILSLGLPLAGSQLATVSLGVVDTMMLGWYDPLALAGQVLGFALFILLQLAGSGFSNAVAPMVASAEAAGDHTQARRVTRMALWLSLAASIVCMPILLSAERIFLALGQKPEIAAAAGTYLVILSWSMFPVQLAAVLKSHLAAMERTRVVLYVTLAALAVNAVADYALIFGRWGMPEMGLAGAALASLLTQVVSFIILVVYVIRALPEQALFVRLWRRDADALGRVFRLGWPIGLTLILEAGMFWLAAVMMGWVGKTALVAHGIAMEFTSITFMFHTGVSQAATVRAGRAVGRGSVTDLKRGALMAMALSTAVVVLSMIVMIGCPKQLLGLFLAPDADQRAEILAAGTAMLLAAAVFQLGDAFQVMGLGLLRGLQDTRLPMIFAAVSYWVFGVPMAYLCAFVLGLGGAGIWVGLACGLLLAAVLMMGRFWRVAVPVAARDLGAASRAG